MLPENNKYMLERYKEIFEAVNPYEHEVLQKAGLLEYHYQNVERDFELTMLEIESEEPVEIKYETSTRINGEMIDNSENQIFFENLERFMDTYQMEPAEVKILNKFMIEIPSAATDSFPWMEVKLFAEKLQPKVHNINSDKWKDAFDLYLVERINDANFKMAWEEYLNG